MIGPLAVIGKAAGKLDSVTPERDLQTAQQLLGVAATIAELMEAAEAAEKRLIALDSMLRDETKSQYDCELGEVVRIRAALARMNGV